MGYAVGEKFTRAAQSSTWNSVSHLSAFRRRVGLVCKKR